MKQKGFYETSMFLEPFNKKTDKIKAQKILALLKGLVRKVEEHYSPITSLSVLGEIDLVLRDPEKINRFTKDSDEIQKDINEILKRFEIISIDKDAISLSSKLLNKSSRGLDPIDVLNFSCAISSKCNAFFFIDSELKNNIYIKEIAKINNLKMSPW
ncbi:PIN domain-containing protein [Candidatus Pacearchaeota archaeon]|nr:PIN domain-containing protein [Candidatus Pacearchaeota archaeon]